MTNQNSHILERTSRWVTFKIVMSNPPDVDEQLELLYDKYQATQNKQDRKIIKAQYNELASQENTRLGRKNYLLL